MARIYTLILLFFIPLNSLFSQEERKIVRSGVKEYNNEKFAEAEVNFRKATDVKPGLFEAEYNIANSLYKQKKYEEAATEYDKLLQQNKDSKTRADLYHNLGNSQIMAQQFDKAIESYKNSLRLRPDDEDTRYNLSYALEKLKQQQQQQQDQNKDQDKKDKEKKDQEKQDQQDQKDKDQQDQKDKEQQNKENQDKNKQQDNQQKKEDESAAEPKISKEEAEQMLNAVQNQEKDVKEKMDKKKAVARPISSEKDW